MLTAEDCLRKAWEALSRGDLAERDRWCALAGNLVRAAERMKASGDPSDIVAGAPIDIDPKGTA